MVPLEKEEAVGNGGKCKPLLSETPFFLLKYCEIIGVNHPRLLQPSASNTEIFYNIFNVSRSPPTDLELN